MRGILCGETHAGKPAGTGGRAGLGADADLGLGEDHLAIEACVTRSIGLTAARRTFFEICQPVATGYADQISGADLVAGVEGMRARILGVGTLVQTDTVVSACPGDTDLACGAGGIADLASKETDVPKLRPKGDTKHGRRSTQVVGVALVEDSDAYTAQTGAFVTAKARCTEQLFRGVTCATFGDKGSTDTLAVGEEIGGAFVPLGAVAVLVTRTQAKLRAAVGLDTQEIRFAALTATAVLAFCEPLDVRCPAICDFLTSFL